MMGTEVSTYDDFIQSIKRDKNHPIYAEYKNKIENSDEYKELKKVLLDIEKLQAQDTEPLELRDEKVHLFFLLLKRLTSAKVAISKYRNPFKLNRIFAKGKKSSWINTDAYFYPLIKNEVDAMHPNRIEANRLASRQKKVLIALVEAEELLVSLDEKYETVKQFLTFFTVNEKRIAKIFLFYEENGAKKIFNEIKTIDVEEVSLEECECVLNYLISFREKLFNHVYGISSEEFNILISVYLDVAIEYKVHNYIENRENGKVKGSDRKHYEEYLTKAKKVIEKKNNNEKLNKILSFVKDNSLRDIYIPLLIDEFTGNTLFVRGVSNDDTQNKPNGDDIEERFAKAKAKSVDMKQDKFDFCISCLDHDNINTYNDDVDREATGIESIFCDYMVTNISFSKIRDIFLYQVNSKSNADSISVFYSKKVLRDYNAKQLVAVDIPEDIKEFFLPDFTEICKTNITPKSDDGKIKSGEKKSR